MIEYARVRLDLQAGRFREKVLDLRPQNEEDKITDAQVGDLARALATSKFDRVVDLSGNALTEQGILRLTEVLGPSYPDCTCNQLVLANNPIRNRGAHAVAQILGCSPLTRLDVSGTRITDDGLGYLALEYLLKILQNSQRLRRVRAEFVNVTTLHT